MVGCTSGLVGWVVGGSHGERYGEIFCWLSWLGGCLAGMGELFAFDWFKGVRGLLRSALDAIFLASGGRTLQGWFSLPWEFESTDQVLCICITRIAHAAAFSHRFRLVRQIV